MGKRWAFLATHSLHGNWSLDRLFQWKIFFSIINRKNIQVNKFMFFTPRQPVRENPNGKAVIARKCIQWTSMSILVTWASMTSQKEVGHWILMPSLSWRNGRTEFKYLEAASGLQRFLIHHCFFFWKNSMFLAGWISLCNQNMPERAGISTERFQRKKKTLDGYALTRFHYKKVNNVHCCHAGLWHQRFLASTQKL